jgi:signal peptidase
MSTDTRSGRRRVMKKERGLLGYLGLGLSLGVLAFVLLLAALVVIVPAISGSTPYTILTSSMQPGLPPGTLVIVKPIDPNDIQIGTIVTYQLNSGEAEVVTHRVIEIQGPSLPGADPSFITKGDANAEPDARPVMSLQVRGAVWYSVPLIGWVNNVVNGDLRAVVIPIVAGLLFLYAGWMIVSGQIDRRRRRAREDEREAEAERAADQARADRMRFAEQLEQPLPFRAAESVPVAVSVPVSVPQSVPQTVPPQYGPPPQP